MWHFIVDSHYFNYIQTLCHNCVRGSFISPWVTRHMVGRCLKWDNSKIETFKMTRFYQTDGGSMCNWPCWAHIWPNLRTTPPPLMRLCLFQSNTSQKPVGQIVSQLPPSLWVLLNSQHSFSGRNAFFGIWYGIINPIPYSFLILWSFGVRSSLVNTKLACHLLTVQTILNQYLTYLLQITTFL